MHITYLAILAIAIYTSAVYSSVSFFRAVMVRPLDTSRTGPMSLLDYMKVFLLLIIGYATADHHDATGRSNIISELRRVLYIYNY